MSREQSERAPKQGFGDSENDKTTGSAAVRQLRIAPVSVNLTVNGRTRTIDRTSLTLLQALREELGQKLPRRGRIGSPLCSRKLPWLSPTGVSAKGPISDISRHTQSS